MGTIQKHSTLSRNLDIMRNKHWTCIKKIYEDIPEAKLPSIIDNSIKQKCDIDASKF